ncbi:MAG: hypothetical protein K0S01_3951, partial [Herbinix sp.]|nr:hypothetical protein [Herbinix sp.]
LGKIYGLFGILLATAIARMLTNMWYEPFILFKNHFKKSPILYFKRQALYWMIAVICCLSTYLISRAINTVSVFNLIVKLVICLIVPNVIILALFFRSKEFEYINEQIITKVKNKILKKAYN